MDAETFEKELTEALNKLTPEDIERIRNKLGDSDYSEPEYFINSKDVCEYCHPDKDGNYKSLLDFRINNSDNGHTIAFMLGVKDLKQGGLLHIEEDYRLYPVVAIDGFNYCPKCGRLLDGGED